MRAYKGFDKDLKCRGFQFEIGGEYEESRAKLCDRGFHVCTSPLDVLRYYPPATSRYCEVELDDVSDERGEDSKRVGRKVKIGAEIGIEGLVNAHIEFVNEQITKTIDDTGYMAPSVSTGDRAISVSTGYMAPSVSTGNRAISTSTGGWAISTSTGNKAMSTSTGVAATSDSTGYMAASTSTGYMAVATVSGADSVAVATGEYGKVKGALGCAIVCVERGGYNGQSCPILAIKSAIVDGNIIKPDTWYTVRSGEWVEAE